MTQSGSRRARFVGSRTRTAPDIAPSCVLISKREQNINRECWRDINHSQHTQLTQNRSRLLPFSFLISQKRAPRPWIIYDCNRDVNQFVFLSCVWAVCARERVIAITESSQHQIRSSSNRKRFKLIPLLFRWNVFCAHFLFFGEMCVISAGKLEFSEQPTYVPFFPILFP